MRIAFVHPDLGLGGAERLVVDAATCLQSAGHRVAIYTAHHDPRRAFDETHRGLLDVRVRGSRLPPHLAGRLRAPCALVRMAYLAAALGLRGGQFDLIVCDLVAHVIPVLRSLTRSPVVFYCHFPDLLLTPPRTHRSYRAYRRPIDWLEGVGLQMADQVLVNSEFTAARLRGAFPHRDLKPVVVHPGIDHRRYAAPPAPAGTGDGQASATILSIARFVGGKNIGLAIESFAALRRRLPSAIAGRWRLVVAGGYDERLRECRETRQALQAQAARLGVADRIDFRFSITDAERLQELARCRCVVYTPVDEHFGFVPLEAMASARPVVAVDGGGVRETVRQGETGWLCAPSSDAFADALASLILDPAAARRMGDAGRRHVVERFSHRAFGVRLETHLREVLARRTAGPVQC